MIKFDYNPKTNKLIVTSDDPEIFDSIRNRFSVKNEGAVFAKRAGRKHVADRKYFITPTGQCRAGLYQEIAAYIISKQWTGVVQTDAFRSYLAAGVPLEPYDVFNKPYALRYYQRDLLEEALKCGRGVCILGTGGGKTLVCASLIQTFYNDKPEHFKCLLVVPDVGLVEQTYKDFKDYGVTFKVAKWSGANIPDPTADVVICNSAILVRRAKDEVFNWVKYVDLVLVDEVHMMANANKISDVIDDIHTTRKFGFTGTLPIGDAAKWSVIGAIGPVIFEKTSAELRSEDYLTNVEVKRLEIAYKTRPAKGTSNPYTDELEFIATNKYRNKLIQGLCVGYQRNILILVNRISHGEKLLEVLQQTDRKVYFIKGEVEVADRMKLIALMEQEEGIICIAISKIFAIGINLKNLHMLIFAAGGKSFIRTVQAIGRGLRLHPSKSMFNIIDICDQLHYAADHAAARLQMYEKEQIKHKTLNLSEKI